MKQALINLGFNDDIEVIK